MPDKFFLSASGDDPVGTVQGLLQGSPQGSAPAERVLWSGRCAVAEYAFDEPASLPRWTLPEQTQVVVTENRVAFADAAEATGGELHWPWPQHLRVQPGNREIGRSATVTQIQLVCAGPDDTFPALVFAGGDLTTVADADRLANVLRQAIARFRVENTAELGLTLPQSRMLSRLVIGPEFSNYQGGEGQTVSLLGSVPVDLPQADEPYLYSPDPYPPISYAPPDPYAFPSAGSFPAATDPYASSGADPYATPVAAAAPYRPAGPSHHADVILPDLASRAADLAARVASLVSSGTGIDSSLARYETETTNLSAFLGPPDPYGSAGQHRHGDDLPADYGYGPAEAARRTATRFTGNAARDRGSLHRRPSDDDLNAPTRGPAALRPPQP